MKLKRLVTIAVVLMFLFTPLLSISFAFASSRPSSSFVDVSAKTDDELDKSYQNLDVKVDDVLQRVATSRVEVVNDEIQIYGNHEIDEKEFRKK